MIEVFFFSFEGSNDRNKTPIKWILALIPNVEEQAENKHDTFQKQKKIVDLIAEVWISLNHQSNTHHMLILIYVLD